MRILIRWLPALTLVAIMGVAGAGSRGHLPEDLASGYRSDGGFKAWMYCPEPYAKLEHETWDRIIYEAWYCGSTDIHFFTTQDGGCGTNGGTPGKGWIIPSAIPATADYRSEIEAQVIDPCHAEADHRGIDCRRAPGGYRTG